MHAGEDQIMRLVERVSDMEKRFNSELGPLILVAASLTQKPDSRRIARDFGAAHALVIRESMHLAQDLALINIHEQNARTSRLTFGLTPSGKALLQKAGAS